MGLSRFAISVLSRFLAHVLSFSNYQRISRCKNGPKVDIGDRWRHLAEVIPPFERPTQGCCFQSLCNICLVLFGSFWGFCDFNHCATGSKYARRDATRPAILPLRPRIRASQSVDAAILTWRYFPFQHRYKTWIKMTIFLFKMCICGPAPLYWHCCGNWQLHLPADTVAQLISNKIST